LAGEILVFLRRFVYRKNCFDGFFLTGVAKIIPFLRLQRVNVCIFGKSVKETRVFRDTSSTHQIRQYSLEYKIAHFLQGSPLCE
jgi:hypothetical protein